MATAMWWTRGCVLLTRHQMAPCTQVRHWSFAGATWRRPHDFPYPKVWRRFTGRVKVGDSTPMKFRIQDVPEDLHDAVILHLTEVLTRDEPMFTALGFSRDPTSMSEMQKVWRDMLEQRVSLVALLDEPGTPVVAGCNVLCVADRDTSTSIPKVQGLAARRLLESMHHVDTTVDVFSRYGVAHYLTGMGLGVGLDYRGLGLGTELLRARMDMGRKLKIPLTVTLFSGPVSQAVAHTVGMDLLTEMPYQDFKLGGQVVFPGASGAFRLMAKRIE